MSIAPPSPRLARGRLWRPMGPARSWRYEPNPSRDRPALRRLGSGGPAAQSPLRAAGRDPRSCVSGKGIRGRSRASATRNILPQRGDRRWPGARRGAPKPAAPKKMIPLSPRNGELSEKAGSESRGDGFLGLGKSGWKPLAVSRRRYWAGSAQLKTNGFILTSRRAKKLIPAKTLPPNMPRWSGSAETISFRHLAARPIRAA